MMNCYYLCVLLTMLGLLAPAGRAFAQSESGSVTGRVTDTATGAPLTGVDISLENTPYTTATTRTGEFRLLGVPPGRHALVARYLGHADQRTDVTITAGQTLQAHVQMASTTFSETIDVRAEPIGDGQAAALNQQRTALSITNVVSADQIGAFPDPNAAEAASRIPGVSIARDQGEGRYVLIRGTEARLNSMMIDGERIPAPEGDLRQVALDAVPADQLQAIEVSKAVTPDMDADAIGGAVNLVTKQAVSRPTLLASVGGGYNALQRDYGQRQFSGTAGRRLADGRLGVLVGGSASSLDRGSENFEAVYDTGNLSDLQLRDYQIARERYGLNFSADNRLGDSHVVTFKGIFNEFKDYEINNRIRFRPPNRRIEHVLKNRHQDQHIRSLAAGTQHVLGARTTFDTRLAWAESQEEQPDRLDTIFRQSNITFSPNVSAASIDPENIQPNPSANNAASATLNAWETEVFKTSDRDVTASVNLRTPLTTRSRFAAFFKGGAKVRDKAKRRDFTATAATPGTTILLPELRDTGFDNERFLEFFPAGYAPFPGIDADASRSRYTAIGRSRGEVDHEGDASNYDADERVVAAYGMAEFFVGDTLLVLPGVRYESTRVDYRGYDVLYDDGGDYVSTRPVTGRDSHGFLLPGLHVRYSVDPRTNVRAAYTRTLARPNYFDLVPYQLVFQEDSDIQRGNPSLQPTVSDNFDVLVEHYFQSVGVVSGGVFFKRMNDYIFPFQFSETAFGDRYQVTQPRNGETATLRGVEVAFQNQLRFLPAPLDGFGVYANYTWTDSSATFPSRTVDSTLPGQSAHLGNFSLWFEKAGFSARSSLNFHGKYVDTVGAEADSDVYYDNHTQLDLSVSQRLTRGIRAYVDVLNLTNAPLRYYQGSSNRPVQEEYYRWWATFGVKLNF